MGINVFMSPSSGPNTLTLVLSVWAAVGPLVGIFIGNYLVRSFQRRQWLADQRLKEWRELLVTLVTSMATIIRCSHFASSEAMAESVLAGVVAGQTINNRLFIAADVRKRQILDKWHEAVNTFGDNHDPTVFGTNVGNIQFQIEEGAKGDISKV